LQRLLPDLEGAVFTAAYWPDSPDEGVRRFEADYSKVYAERPGLLAAQAYAAARLGLERLRAGARDRGALRAALSRVDNWAGVSGRTTFDGRQDAVKRPTLIQVRGGALEVLKEP
jgi:ABC-type branched-subunit amino acid transport system substrate-binding protein